MSVSQEQLKELLFLKDKLTSKMGKTATNCGFRQQLKKLDSLNREISRLTREGKNAKG